MKGRHQTREDFQMKREVYELDPTGNPFLEVVLTEEGVVMDCYNGTTLVGTVAMTADEWYDWVVENDPMNRSNR